MKVIQVVKELYSFSIAAAKTYHTLSSLKQYKTIQTHSLIILEARSLK